MKYFGLYLLVSLGIAAATAGCSSAPKGSFHPTPFPQAANPAEIEVAWSKKIDGYLYDLKATPDGSRILVATKALDQSTYRLQAFTGSGASEWEYPHAVRASSIDLFADGELAVVSFEDGTVKGLDDSGEVVFTLDRRCLVVALNDGFLCYRKEGGKDSARDQALVELYDKTGKKLRFYSGGNGEQSLRTVRVSPDRKNIVLVFHEDKVHLLREDLSPVWKKKLQGEVVDVDITPGDAPQVALVLNSFRLSNGKWERSGQEWALLDFAGKALFREVLTLHTQGVRFSANQNPLFFSGNGTRGQYVAAFYGPNETWRQHEPARALFSAPPIALRDGILVGIEDTDPERSKRHAHLFAFSGDGEVLWNLPLSSPNHAYFYAAAYEGSDLKLIVATDDSVLTAYELR